MRKQPLRDTKRPKLRIATRTPVFIEELPNSGTKPFSPAKCWLQKKGTEDEI
ncbi:hypothetical protein ANAPC1_00389 [Anaplasma phagocytophilum]|uniref:Uncharacterized protein n=1 Tax=Anaplasma phagocytophilum TaxID=948 RepID=A0AA45USJ7_ANAPH|nr:hypothetical protein ANAPC1_00389 [Anaplasma phagocytophilum]SBO30543.1 hypothetical protein ANAPC4_00225 [Anaplasma phagocytophilum]SBO30894.1 hypothetical protein ANAPC2_00446 [Anaplasma phagocytophilum]SBO31146.1 hypothetical protein ANAPC3_00430 [Anaplasma phagocytophilum]SBO31406.1 hypothetical protein ANAPC3_00518 [Anaplasma phagocytophilum]